MPGNSHPKYMKKAVKAVDFPGISPKYCKNFSEVFSIILK